MATTATRHGDTWGISGAKRWIGYGSIADHIILWARDTAEGQIKAFIVDRGTPGPRTEKIEKIENKISLRVVKNTDILLDNVRFDESARLPGATSFRDAGALLTASQVWVAWQTVGLQLAAYDHALGYALQRCQLGKQIASFQLVQEKLVQEKLVRILENTTASLGTMVRISQLQQRGALRSEHAAMAKASGSAWMRESLAMARGILGVNGISTDFRMARIFADAKRSTATREVASSTPGWSVGRSWGSPHSKTASIQRPRAFKDREHSNIARLRIARGPSHPLCA